MEPRRLGPIVLSPGVTPLQIGIFLIVVSAALCLQQIVGVVQPYLFDEVMHIPADQQGRLTGFLQTAQYIAVALFIIPAGSLSDRFGRKPILLIGIAGYCVTLLLMPFTASVFMVLMLRFVFGMASTGHTIGGAGMIIDYPSNATRGKFVSLMISVQDIVAAAVVGRFIPKIPAWLMAHGYGRGLATEYALWTVAAIGFFGVLVGIFALRQPTRIAPSRTAPGGWRGIVESTRAVWALCKTDPAFAIVVLVSFVLRADYFVTASFLSIWIMGASRAHGVDAATALSIAGTMFMVFTVTKAGAPLLFGYLADRVNRVGLLIATLLIGGVAFFLTVLVSDVSGWLMMFVVGFIGIAETAQAVASQAVLGDRTPESLRGSAWGTFVLMGTFSVIIVSYVSGMLYDKIGYIAPFMFLGGMNVIFAVAAIFMLSGKRARAATRVSPESA